MGRSSNMLADGVLKGLRETAGGLLSAWREASRSSALRPLWHCARTSGLLQARTWRLPIQKSGLFSSPRAVWTLKNASRVVRAGTSAAPRAHAMRRNHRQLHSGEELTTNICRHRRLHARLQEPRPYRAPGELGAPRHPVLLPPHCRALPAAPCGHSSEGGAALLGRRSLVTHLTKYHRGHGGREAGLDLSWGASWPSAAKGREGDAAAVAAAGAPAAVAAAGAHAAAVAVPSATAQRCLLVALTRARGSTRSSHAAAAPECAGVPRPTQVACFCWVRRRLGSQATRQCWTECLRSCAVASLTITAR